MKPSALWATLLTFVALVAIALASTAFLGNGPLLGLDLQGGLSVIYAPDEPADDDQLIIIQDLMRDQLESFGIAEPDVRVEGGNIIADLPGVSDQEKAFDALNISGIVELRPVLACTQAYGGDSPFGPATPATTVPSTPATSTPATSGGEGEQGAPAASGPLGVRSAPPAARRPTTPASTTPASTTLPSEPDTTDPIVTGPVVTAPADTAMPEGYDQLPYPGADAECIVGPPGGSGEVFERKGAMAGIDQLTGGWVVNVDLRPEGEVVWNQLAAECYAGSATCPTRQLAIVLDDVIQSAPVVQAQQFTKSVQISGSFTESEANQLASVLNRGAFPVQVHQERVETVSPTAGKGSLNAALIAGLIGAVVMLAFMVAHYGRLSVVILTGLIVWGALVYAVSTWVSRSTNYALTLAGATGIIISIGVTVDTYVVYFERLRDEVRHGRSYRNAAPRSFASSWRTVWAADLVTLMSAVILFWLSVGSVKGFALYLGLTTIADLVVFYFFIQPATVLLARSGFLDRSRSTEAIGAPA